MTRKQKAEIFGMMLLILTATITIFVAIYFLTAFGYQTVGQAPPAFLTYLINIAISLMVCFVVALNVGRYLSKRQSFQSGVFQPIFEAMQKIASGDFSVRLDNRFRDNLLIRELTTGFNQMALELNQMEQMRQEFISTVSHEIQSPLTSIRGFAKALHNEHLSENDRNHYLTIIEMESLRLSKLADNLLKLASLESDQVKFEPKPYRLDKQIRNLILTCEPQWASKQIEMDVALDEVTIHADEDLMSQVWMNLIHNGIKFTPDGGKICVALRRQDSTVEFRISDTGIGISEDDQARIFERFYKTDKSRTRSNNGGSGLGLAIAKKIVEMHKGTITVDSKLGAGTRFTVTLPTE